MTAASGPAGSATVGALAAAIAAAFPPQWAEAWDKIGLLAGDPDAPAGRVLCALDPTSATLRAAREAGASTVLTHHPVYLQSPVPVPGFGSAGVVFEAVRDGIALVNAHTNLDRSPEGGDALPLAVGLKVLAPLERSVQPMELVTVYAPSDAQAAIVEAMTAAGAGRIGQYAGCAFSTPGEGGFTPLGGAQPVAGIPARDRAGDDPAVRMTAQELRIEMVAAPGTGAGVAAAARAAHPYEEPLIAVSAVSMTRGAARLGRLCEPSAPTTVGELARAVGASLECTPRIWGDPDVAVATVATASGSGGSLVRDAVDAGATVLLTGELRYHDALDALGSGLALIEAGHDATEWPMVPLLARAAGLTPGLDQADIVVAQRETLWRTA